MYHRHKKRKEKRNKKEIKWVLQKMGVRYPFF
jgi:hypothetical protein